MSVPQPVVKWDCATVCSFLEGIGLPQLTEAFKANAVNGADLIGLTDDDYKTSLGCTPLQVKKIRKELEAYGIQSAGSASIASAPSGEAAPPAPAAEPVPPPSAPTAPAPVAAAPPAAAPPVDSGRGPALQAEINQISAQIAEAQRGAQAYATAQQHLRKADAELGSALRSLTVTQASGFTETVQDARIGIHGGGLFGRNRGAGRMMDRRNDFGHNAIEMATVHKATAMIKDAGNEIMHAKQFVPQLPFIQPAHVQSAMGGVMLNALLMPGMLGDMMQNAKVNKAKQDVADMKQEVVQALDWCNNNMNAAQTQASQLQGTLMAKQGELAALAH